MRPRRGVIFWPDGSKAPTAGVPVVVTAPDVLQHHTGVGRAACRKEGVDRLTRQASCLKDVGHW